MLTESTFLLNEILRATLGMRLLFIQKQRELND